MTFDEWMGNVDARVEALVGVSVHDLADQPFADWFADGITSGQAARLVVESEL